LASGRAIVGRSQRANRALIVVQVALSVTLLSSAGLLGQTIYNLRHQDFGFHPDGLIAVDYWLNARDTSIEHSRQVSTTLLERIRAVPGVSGIAASTAGFFSGKDMFNSLSIPGMPSDGPGARIDFVSSSYFDVMSVPLVRGRMFQEKEDVPVAVANEAFVRKVLQGRDPLGIELQSGNRKGIRIIGVVRDARYRNARIDYEPALFFPASAATRAPSRVEIRAAGDPRAVAGSLRNIVRETDPDVVVESISLISEDIDRSFNRELALAKLVGTFSALALTLSCIGLYGMMSYAVSRRASEFGLRMALGARPRQVLRLVLRDTGWLLLAGIVIGVPCAWAASRLLEGLLFGVKADDPRILGVVVVALIGAGLSAAWIPARRASSVDPATALRIE
jgi:putative ABC transport system permease protein